MVHEAPEVQGADKMADEQGKHDQIHHHHQDETLYLGVVESSYRWMRLI